MNKIKILKVSYDDDLQEIKYFFDKICGTSSETFTYYKKRDYSIIKNHLCTYLLFVDNIPAAYSHLEKVDDVVWFGICVGERYIGKKLGEKLMVETLNNAHKINIKSVVLSVYKENIKAINLYKKLGFNIFKDNDVSFFMKKDI